MQRIKFSKHFTQYFVKCICLWMHSSDIQIFLCMLPVVSRHWVAGKRMPNHHLTCCCSYGKKISNVEKQPCIELPEITSATELENILNSLWRTCPRHGELTPGNWRTYRMYGASLTHFIFIFNRLLQKYDARKDCLVCIYLLTTFWIYGILFKLSIFDD